MCFMGLSLARLFSCLFFALCFSSCFIAKEPSACESGIAPIVALRGRQCFGDSGGLVNSKLGLSLEEWAGDGIGDPSGDMSS